MRCAEYRELIAAHVDGLLAPEEEALASAHVATCPHCAPLLAGERQFAQALRSRHLIRPTPVAVRERVVASVDVQDQPSRRLARPALRWGRPGYRAALAGAVAALAVAVVVLPYIRHRRESETDVLHDVLAYYHEAQTQTLKLEMRTDKPKVLEFFFADKGIGAPTRIVMDLRALGFKLVGGSVVPLAAATSAMMLYRGERGWLLCHRFRAADMQLPAGGEVVDDDTYYAVDGVSVCAYRDGDAVCLMASALSVEDLKKLLTGYL